MDGDFDKNILKKLIDRAGGVYVYSFDKRRNVYINKTYTSLTGYTPTQIRGMSSFDFASLFHPSDRPKITEHMRRMRSLPDNEFLEIEYRFKKADGSWMWCFSQDSVFSRKEGEVASFIGTFVDVSRRKLSEKKLKENEFRYSQLIKHAPTGIYQTDFENQKFTQVNDCMCQMLGYPRQQLLSMNPLDLLDEEGRTLFQQRVEKWLSGGKPDESVEYKVKAKDGRQIIAQLNVTFKKDGQGKPKSAYVIAHDVTQAREIVQALDLQRQLFRGIFDHMPVLLVLWDPKLNYFTLNRHAEETLGWSTVEANKHDLMSMVYPNPQYRKQVTSFMQSLKPRWARWQCMTKEGVTIPVEWTNIKLKDDTMLGIGIDISRTQKLAEQLKKTQEIAQIGSWQLDVKVNKLTWSDETYKIFGVTQDDFNPTYEGFLKLIHPQDRVKVDEAYRDSKKNKADGYTVEHRIINHQTGATRHVHEKCEHIKDDQGKVIRSIGMVRDVTKEKQEELRKQAMLDSLKKLSSRTRAYAYELNTIFKSVTEPLMVVDQFGRVEKANQAARDSLALRPVGYTLLNLVELLKIKDEQNHDFNPKLVVEKVLNGQTIRNIKIRFTDSRGYQKIALLSAAPVRLEGETQISVLVWHDVTDIEQTEEFRKQLIRDLSHQLKTPLSIIQMAADLIENKTDNKKVDENMRMIKRNTEDMSKLITHILKVSELESGKIQARSEKVDLVKTIKSQLKQIKPLASKKNLKLKYRGPASLTMYSDAQKIGEVIENLLSNALKYTEEGQITLSLEKQDGKAQITVEDTGVGLNKKQKQKIFTRFYKDDPSVPGTGLGLNIVAENLKLLKGDVTVDSRGAGKGSAFKVNIPLKNRGKKINEKKRTDS